MSKEVTRYRTKQLGQLRPADTTAASVFSPDKRDRFIVTRIVIANVTSSAATYRLFHDEGGSTYDEDTALAWDISLPANTSTSWNDEEIYMNNPSGNLAVRSGTGDAINFTVYGYDGSL